MGNNWELERVKAIMGKVLEVEAVGVEAVGVEAVDVEAVGVEAVGAEAVDVEAVDVEALDQVDTAQPSPSLHQLFHRGSATFLTMDIR